MSDTYTKLFSSITASTIVSEPVATRWAWVTMLAAVKPDGCVYGSVPGLARLANITLAETETALACFLAPDPYSRTQDNEGRRIEVIDGGWRLLNHAKYDEIRSEAERAEYKRNWDREHRPSGWQRTKQSDSSPTVRQQSDESPTKSDSPTASTSTSTSKEQDQKRQARASRLPDDWQPSDAVRIWAAAEYPTVRIDDVLAEFADHWRAVPGQRGCKLDWDATFRNRVRAVAQRFGSQNANSSTNRKLSASERVAAVNAEAERRNRAA